MRCFRAAIIISSNSCGTDKDVTYANFAAAVGLTMITSKAFNEDTGKFIFPVR